MLLQGCPGLVLVWSSWGLLEGICLPGILFAVKKKGVFPWEAPVGISVCPWDELQDPCPLEKNRCGAHLDAWKFRALLWWVSAVWDEGGSRSWILKELFPPCLRLWNGNGNRNAQFCILGMPMVPREDKPWVGPATYWLLVEELCGPNLRNQGG